MTAEYNFDNNVNSFINKIKKDSLVPFTEDIKTEELKSILLNEIKNNTYQPRPPREYIIFNKNKDVARIVPTFTLKDYCVYFYCIMSLQDCLCKEEDRVEGTFGGWRISNPIKTMEKLEKEGRIDEFFMDDYIPVSTLSFSNWLENWKEFSKLSYIMEKQYYNDHQEEVIVIFDIANFYDNIRLDILEKELRLKCIDKQCNNIIDLLIYFLKYWNKPFENYFPKSVGIPQEETSDCSRILANFYLRNYDKFIYNLSNKYNCKYLRYADDMTIFAPNKIIAKKILFEASKFLHTVGLNINTGKVNYFNHDEYCIYQGFDISFLLDEQDKYSFNIAVNKLLEIIKEKKNVHYGKFLRRLISILAKKGIDYVDMEYRDKLIQWLIEEDNIITMDFIHLKSLFKIYKKQEKAEELFSLLDSYIQTTNFNSYHYNLFKLYKYVKRDDFDFDNLLKEIDKRRI